MVIRSGVLCLLAASVALAQSNSRGKWTVIGWNDLGMHCVDGKDYSIYSILPPFNTFHAQVVDSSGKLVKNGSGITLSYSAVADPDGSINKSSIGKTNFWEFSKPLYGATLAPDMGLAGFAMPGASNRSIPMKFDSALRWFTGEGVPIMPYDDAGRKNYYPLMRITAKDSGGRTLNSTDIVLPVSDEMDCKACHASGSVGNARPNAGWAFLSDPERDYKINVLRIHDDRRANSTQFQDAARKLGLNPAGLYTTAITDKHPVLCASCHASNALPGTGVAGISPLTRAVHAKHANVVDPTNLLMMDVSNNRTACYRCHPGSETKCLRGAMGSALNPDGTMTMQCQSCHGSMSQVGAANRAGWLDQPTCQNCHTGTALKNNGQIRYTSVFDGSGLRRQAADQTFATSANAPAAGLSLYRFSQGHGGLQCEACHGSTHAEYTSSHRNDNLQSVKLQGHAGTLVECTTCHSSVPSTVNGGPHGMHPVGQTWVGKHGDAAERNRGAECRSCHGMDYRGSVLSKTHADRTFRVEDRQRSFPKGTQIGCYNCHNGPRGD